MSINIHKRTRTFANETYSDWSVWTPTNDVPPYINTDLIQYQIEKTFETMFLQVFSNVMSAAIGDDTPYSKTLDYLQTEFKDDNLTPKEKANLKAQVMANITTSITNNAMMHATQITNKELRIGDELAILKNQRDVSDGTVQFKINQAEQTAENAKQNALFVKEKIAQLIKAAKDNNRIQAGKILEELFGQHKIGGGVITEDMFKVIFDMVLNLYNNLDVSLTTNPDSISTTESSTT